VASLRSVGDRVEALTGSASRFRLAHPALQPLPEPT
jgi:hypothetical protein